MSSVKISGNASGTGILTIAAPNTNTDRTLTLPDEAGTLVTSANVAPSGIPAFRAYASATLALTGAVPAKIQYDTEVFDTTGDYDPTTNYRYTPSVEGYYQVNFWAECQAVSAIYFILQLQKNGANDAYSSNFPTSPSAGPTASGSALVYMNGTTDYLEVRALVSANATLNNGAAATGFTAHLVSKA